MKLLNVLAENNFANIEHILENIRTYFASNADKIESDQSKSELKKQFEEKHLFYCEDKQESFFFDQIRMSNVAVEKIPSHWLTKTWAKKSTVSKNNENNSSISISCSSLVNFLNLILF